MTLLKFQEQLLVILNDMKSISEQGDKYLADNLASLITNLISSATGTSTDTGVATSGEYTGASQFSLNIDSELLATSLLNTFLAKSSDSVLATNLASNINSACSIPNLVSGSTTGTATSGTSSFPIDEAPVSGTFQGNSEAFQSTLSSSFTNMGSEASKQAGSGDSQFASAFTQGLKSYINTATVKISLLSPIFVSGTGSGKLTLIWDKKN